MGDKKGAAVRDRRTSHALELYEKAVKALGKKDFDRASELLDELIEGYPQERDLLERARAFRLLCDRSREKRASRPKSFEDLLNYGVFLHNRGDFEGPSSTSSRRRTSTLATSTSSTASPRPTPAPATTPPPSRRSSPRSP